MIMKKILLTAVMTAAILTIAGCEQFTTSYQRIDDSELRMLDFIWESGKDTADASPGDTVTLTAVFAGKKVDLLNDIEWGISFNVVRDLLFGSITVVDSMRLDTVALRIDPIDWSPNTQSIRFRTPIPKDIMRTSRHIPDQWTDVLPAEMKSRIPAVFASMTKNQIVDTLESFLASGVHSAQRVEYLPQLLQFFTVPIRVTAKIKESGKLPHTIRSDQTIRYNRRLRAAGFDVPINSNPRIDSVVVRKVKGENVRTFNSKDSLQIIRIYPSEDPEILIEDDYTYFLEAFTDNSLDNAVTMSGLDSLETHYSYWQFQLDSDEAKKVHHSDYMDTGGSGMGSDLAKLTPPSNRRITKFVIWVTVKDHYYNEMNRPEASTLREISGRFVYK